MTRTPHDTLVAFYRGLLDSYPGISTSQATFAAWDHFGRQEHRSNVHGHWVALTEARKD